MPSSVIVSSTDYFRYNDADEYISEETIAEIQENTSETVSGSGYMTDMTTMVSLTLARVLSADNMQLR